MGQSSRMIFILSKLDIISPSFLGKRKTECQESSGGQMKMTLQNTYSYLLLILFSWQQIKLFINFNFFVRCTFASCNGLSCTVCMGLTLPSPASCACSTAEQCLGSPGHLQYLTVLSDCWKLGKWTQKCRNVQGKRPHFVPLEHDSNARGLSISMSFLCSSLVTVTILSSCSVT